MSLATKLLSSASAHIILIKLRPVPLKFGPFEISPLMRNFFVIKYFPLTAVLNYLTYWVLYIKKNATFKI